MSPKIAIIGAGPGGCMLARLLHLQSIPCTIFEGEHSIDYRSQGGTLDMRVETGMKAIKEADLWDEFQEYARYDGESLLICDKTGTAWMKRAASGKIGEKRSLQEGPEIDRAALRRILMESLPEGIVRWNHKVVNIGSDRSLHFENGTVETGFDLIVGADGAFSKVRNYLSSEKPFHSGLSGFFMSIPDAANTAPFVNRLVNRGTVFGFSDYKNLKGQQTGDGSIIVAYVAHFEEGFTKNCGFDITDLGAVKQYLRKELHDWSPELKQIFESANSEVTWRDLYMLPVGFRWDHKEGVTLLGDAAHLMTQFAGIGVNNALNDARLLSHAIVNYANAEKTKNLDSHIKDYEDEMFRVTQKAAALTNGVMHDMMFTPGAPRTSIESYMTRFAVEDLPGWMHPFVKVVIHTGYFFYKLVY